MHNLSRNQPGCRGYQALLLIMVSLLLNGCGTMMKELSEGLSDEYVDFENNYTLDFDPRGQQANPVTTSTKQLDDDDYVNLGQLSVKYVSKRCFPGEECSTETHQDNPTQRLLDEAGKRGGDLVKLSANNANGSGEAVKNGACISTTTQQVPYSVCDYETICQGTSCYTRQTICRTEYRSQTVCTEWVKIYGTEYFQRSSASVWRLDPQLKVQVRFGDEFHEALKQGDSEATRRYLEQGMRADIQDLRGRYPILVAVKANKNAPEISRILLQQEADPTVENNKALAIASDNDDTALVRILLEHGANPNDKVGIWGVLLGGEKDMIKKGGPIINASNNNNTEMVQVLLEHDADPDVDNGQPLRNAINHENQAMLQVLLDAGASVREDGVLTTAVDKGDIELVRSFLERGAFADNRSWSGETPLQSASESGRVAIMRLLLESGASVNKRGVGGEHTPLMLAARAGHVEAVRLLIEYNAAVNIDDVPTGVGWIAGLAGIEGKTALSMARERMGYASSDQRKADYQKIIDLLIVAGAKDKP